MSLRTLFLSGLIGLYCILVALSMITRRQATLESVTAFLHDPSMIFILGLITLAAGLAMVLAHNIWSGGALVVIVTIVGWITLLKSLLLLFLPPEMEAGMFLGQLHYRQLFYLYGAFSLVLGVYLTHGGFMSRSRISQHPRGSEVGLPDQLRNTVKVVASDHTPMGIPRTLKMQASQQALMSGCGRQFETRRRRQVAFSIRLTANWRKWKKWLLNYARNANKPTPVASAITTKRASAARRLASMRFLNQVISHQKTRKIEVRCDPEQLSAPCDYGVRKFTSAEGGVRVPAAALPLKQ
jgi:hypothetical protein